MNAQSPIVATGFVVTVSTDADALPAHWPRAGAVGEARCHVFQLAEYLALLARTVGSVKGRQLHYVSVATDDGAPLLCLALAITPVGPVRVLGFADFDVSDYNAPVLFPNAIQWTRPLADALWQAIAAALPAFDCVDLAKMPARVGDLDNPLALLDTEPDAESGHGNDLTLGREAVMASQNQLKTTQRNIRKLEKEGSLELVFAGNRAERDRFIATAIAHKQRRFDETELAGFHAEPEKRDFFEEGTEALAEAGLLNFCALLIDGEIAATSWNLVHGERLYAMMMGFDDGRWARVGPSRILNYLLLEWLFQNGFAFYDLGVGNEAYKVQQCETEIPLLRTRFAASARGRVFLGLIEGREAARRTALWRMAKSAKFRLGHWRRSRLGVTGDGDRPQPDR